MTIQAKIAEAKATIKYKFNIKLEEFFFDYPLSLKLLKSLAATAIAIVASKLKEKVLEELAKLIKMLMDLLNKGVTGGDGNRASNYIGSLSNNSSTLKGGSTGNNGSNGSNESNGVNDNSGGNKDEQIRALISKLSLTNLDLDNKTKVKALLKELPISSAIFETANNSIKGEYVNNLMSKCKYNPTYEEVEDIDIDFNNFKPNEESLGLYLKDVENKNSLPFSVINNNNENANNLSDENNTSGTHKSGNANGSSSNTSGLDDETNQILKQNLRNKIAVNKAKFNKKFNLGFNFDDLLAFLSILIMIYYIILLMISFFKNTDLPSMNLAKYISTLINTVKAVISDLLSQVSEGVMSQIDKIKAVIAVPEALVTGFLLAATLYAFNRKKHQGESALTLEDELCPAYIENNPIIAQDENFPTNKKPRGIDLRDVMGIDIEDASIINNDFNYTDNDRTRNNSDTFGEDVSDDKIEQPIREIDKIINETEELINTSELSNSCTLDNLKLKDPVVVPSIPFEIKATDSGACSVDLPFAPDGDFTGFEPIEFKPAADANNILKDIDLTNVDPYNLPANFEDLLKKPAASEIGNLSTNIIIVNKRKQEMRILVKKNKYVTTSTIVGMVNGVKILSPKNGIVDKIEKNKIYIKDVEDGTNETLEEDTKKLGELYEEQTTTKVFLMNWCIQLLYPYMVKEAPKPDGLSVLKKALFKKGVLPSWVKLKESFEENEKQDYIDNIQIITGVDNVRFHAENESLSKIKDSIDELDENFHKIIKSYNKKAQSIAKKCLPDDEEYLMIDYYLFDVIPQLMELETLSKIEKSFLRNINSFVRERIIINQYNPITLLNKSKELTRELIGGRKPVPRRNLPIIPGKDPIPEIEIKPKAITDSELDNMFKYKGSKSIQDWLKLNARKGISKIDKDNYIKKITFYSKLYASVRNKKNTVSYKTNHYQLAKENRYIKNLLNKLWGRLDELPKEIEGMMAKFIEMKNGSILNPPIDTTLEDGRYQQYLILPDKNTSNGSDNGTNDDLGCLPKEGDTNLGGGSETDYGNILYWLKWGGIATLVGLIPIYWSTGIPPPLPPILLPVIYIPIVAIPTSYGFIVIGLTICGMWPSPLILFANLTTSPTLPMGDPLQILKKEVTALKNTLIEELRGFKTIALKGFLDEAESELIAAIPVAEAAKEALNEHKGKKPPRTKEYAQERALWTLEYANLSKDKLEKSLAKYSAQTKYSVIYIMYTYGGGGSADKAMEALMASLKVMEDLIEKGFAVLLGLISKLENIVLPLPITLKPDSVSFAFTPKNPMPLTAIKCMLTQGTEAYNSKVPIFAGINELILDPILLAFRVPTMNEQLMLPGGIKLDFNAFKKILKLAAFPLMPVDPFPAIENLSPANLAFILYLASSFLFAGAKQNGVPGMLPLPIP